jgi:hypothetical protein
MRTVIGLALLLLGTSNAYSQSAWTLWARTCDLRRLSQCDAPWYQAQTFEAERWCRAARTSRNDEALRQSAESGNRTIREYQCRPDTAPPPGAKGAK